MESTAGLYIYLVRPARPAMLTEGPDADEMQAVQLHVAYLEVLLDEGSLILAGRTQTVGPETFGICIFRAESQQHAAEIFRADPAVRMGVFVGEVYPYAIAFKCFEL